MKTSIEEMVKRNNEICEKHITETNKMIDKFHMAYKIKDSEGNVFCFAGIENGFPLFRGKRGSKHIFDLCGYDILQKYEE